LLLGSRSVPGEIKALLNECIDIDRAMFTCTFARVQQHILYDGVRTAAVLHDLVEIAAQGFHQLDNLTALGIVKAHVLQRLV
jgi:hypothetical protein